jgi:LPXTG-motif cell wall-anchored protein
MTPRLTTAALVSALLLAAPVPALALSAGDEQYADPIEEPAPPPSNSGGDSGSAPSAPAAPGAPSAPGAPAAPTDPGSTATAPAASGELPRTGTDAWLLALVGGALLLAGAGVRIALAQRA